MVPISPNAAAVMAKVRMCAPPFLMQDNVLMQDNARRMG
jgi:hypothetical protein